MKELLLLIIDYQKLKKKSAMSAGVTLRLIRNAKNLNYYEIIKQEINVAKNMVMKNPDFDLFIENKLN